MQRRISEGDHPDVALDLNNVATCLMRIGRAEEALPLYGESLAMSRRIYEGDHMYVAVALGNVGACLKSLGRTEESVPLYKETLAMSRRLIGGDHGHIVKDLTNLAFALLTLGRTDESARHLDEAVAMARRLGSPFMHAALANAAAVRLKARDPSAAVPLLEEAIDQIESLRAEAVGLTEADRALYFAELKQYGAFELAVLAQRALGRDGDALRFVERGRARSLLDLLDRSRLDPLAEVAAQARERGDARTLGEIDKVSEALRNADADVGRLTHAASVPQQDRAEIARVNAELASARRAREEVLRRRAQIVRSRIAIAAPADVAALQGLAGADGCVLVYSVSEEGTTLFLVPPAGGAIRAMDLAWSDGGPVTADSLAAKVAEHGARIQAGREGPGGSSWSAGHALFRALVPGPVWSDILKARVVYAVPDGALHRLPLEALPVDDKGTAFWIDVGPSVAYGASGSALVWSRDRGDRQRSQGRLDEAVVLGDPVFARDAIAPPAHGVVVLGLAEQGQARAAGIEPGDVILGYDAKEIDGYDALIRAMKEAREDAGRPSPDTLLAVWRAGERRDVKVAVGPLGVVLSQRPAPDAWSAFRAGEPVLARAALERGAAMSRLGRLVSLPGTRREAEEIAKALGGDGGLRTTMLLGEDATLPKLRRAAPRARYLHIATHGLADETGFASYSSLALTLPKTPTAEDDGFLTLADVLAGWRGALAGCELVVLSACETQKGYEQRDEGVFALPVGFLYAGAPSVIASLWRVDDASMVDLFADFYGRLRGSGGKLAAFTEARRAFRRKLPEPYFWAPFVFIGDPR
jgi:tetratricopeptide (TPR) repeat protein